MAEHVVIIGNGVTGVTAARFIRKRSDARITMISDETDHHFARTALMYIYMGHMRYRDTKPYEDHFWPKNRIDLVRATVEAIDTDARRLHLSTGATVDYDKLLVATGSVPNKVGWPGQDLDGVQGLYGMRDLEAMAKYTEDIERAVVVGGGLIGIEVAEMLHTRHIPVTFLVREKSYQQRILPAEEGRMVIDEIRRHGIDLRLETELAEILPDEGGRARAVVTSAGDEVPCQFVALTIGVRPNIGVVEASGIETNRGVLVNEYLETNIPGVYAAGDCAEFREPALGHKPIEQLWYTGRRQGRTVAATICGERTRYEKGLFFNSAKYFTIEYQTYGDITPTLEDGRDEVAWSDAEAKKLIRIQYAPAEGDRVLGFNLLGIRYRQAVCERWIYEERPLAYVLDHLGEANFDPEFIDHHEAALRAQVEDEVHPERSRRGQRAKVEL